MTARLILCPPTDAALDRLNDARDIDRKMRDEARLHSNHTTRYGELEHEWTEACNDIVDALLRGAVYVDPEPDPRVAALEAQVASLQRLTGIWNTMLCRIQYGETYRDLLNDDIMKQSVDAYQECRQIGALPDREASER